MLEMRKFVPDYYEKSRDFQVFLKLLDLIVNTSKADIDFLISCLNPTQCRARLLPLLSHYVGQTGGYLYDEKVKFNRAVIKTWPLLKRNRGSETGISMAIALAFSQVDGLEEADIFKLFNIDYEEIKDRYGRVTKRIRVYVYFPAYLSKLYYLIEAVRPAGVIVEIVPSLSINASETVVLTDEFKMLGYNYCTGKLIWISDIPIYIENSWQLMKNNNPTGEYLVDGSFYDEHHNYLKKYLDSEQRIMETVEEPGIGITEKYTGYIIKAPNVYKDDDGELTFTGEAFNLNHSARVLNTAYEIRSGGQSGMYFVSADTWRIFDASKQNVKYYLKDELLGSQLVKRVYSIDGNIKYNWYIDLSTGYFVKDNAADATMLIWQYYIQWDESSYISKKRYVLNIMTDSLGNEMVYTTPYFVNKYEDIQDSAGNIILSRKDRYKVSDSASVGFSEVHPDNSDCGICSASIADKTWIFARDYSYTTDKDYFNNYIVEDFNDYTGNSGYKDTRINILPSDLRIDQIIREYDGTNYIGVVNELSGSKSNDNSATIPVDKLLPDIWTNENIINQTPSFYIDVMIRPSDTVFDIFSELHFTFSNELVRDKKEVFVNWKLAENAELYYNVMELPERLVFANKGAIVPRKLRFTDIPIQVPDKVYDGTNKVLKENMITKYDPPKDRGGV